MTQYRYIPDPTTPLAAGADLDITGEITGVVISNQDNIGTVAFTKAPRQATHDAAGVASLFADAAEPGRLHGNPGAAVRWPGDHRLYILGN